MPKLLLLGISLFVEGWVKDLFDAYMVKFINSGNRIVFVFAIY